MSGDTIELMAKLFGTRRWSRMSGEMVPDDTGLWVQYEDVERLLNAMVVARREFDRIQNKLLEGTMHCIICNGNHNAKVGAEGLICNCPPGQEIKRLRHEKKELYEAFAAHMKEQHPNEG